MTSEPVDFSRMSDDRYVAGLAPDQLWEIVQRWDDECSNRAEFLQRGPELSKEDFLTLTDVVMMIAESRALDSNAVVPIYTSVRDSGRDVVTGEEWEPSVLLTQRLEAKLRWETAAIRPDVKDVVLSAREAAIVQALDKETLTGEDLVRKMGGHRSFNSNMRSALSGLVRRGILKKGPSGSKRGYFLNPAFYGLL